MAAVQPQAFRWAILGTGPVSHKFAHGLAALGGRALVGMVASRTRANAEAFAASFAIPRVSTEISAETLAGLDAVYVATPVSEHERYALIAIAAGKPVLVEKPFAMDAVAARRVAAAAEAAGVFCMEALWTRFLPLTRALKRRVAEGQLGDIRQFEGSFLGANQADPAQSLFDPARGGGALLQRGVYPLSLARHLLGPIVSVTARGRIGATGVDEDCVLVLSHRDGALSTVRASLRAGGANSATLSGSKATVHIDAPIYRPEGMRIVATVPQEGAPRPKRFAQLRESGPAQRLLPLVQRLRGAGGQSLRFPVLGNGYGHEALELMEGVARGQTRSEIMPLSESVEIMEVIDEALAQIRSGRGA